MTTKIKLVQGDTRPDIVVNLRASDGTTPIDIAGTTAKMYFRKVGSTNLVDTLTGDLEAGYEEANGSLTVTAPYNVPGKGGRVSFPWNGSTLASAGDHEGEIEITFGDGTIQTVYDILKFKVRSQF